MVRNGRLAWLGFLAVTIMLASSQVADAQRDEGRRERGGKDERRFGGGFGSLTLRLAMIDKVQEALKLSDEQKEKIEELDDEFREQRRKLFDNGAAGEDMQKLSEQSAAKLAELLDDEQEKRLKGISIQLLGAGAVLNDPALAKELDVTDEQQEKLRDAFMSNMRSMGEAFRELRDLSREERRAKVEKLRAQTNQKMLDVLTAAQQEKLESLKGEKVDIDMSELRGPGRGFDGRGRGDRGDRERRDRDRDDADSDSDKSA